MGLKVCIGRSPRPHLQWRFARLPKKERRLHGGSAAAAGGEHRGRDPQRSHGGSAGFHPEKCWISMENAGVHEIFHGKTMRLNMGKMLEFYGEFYGSSMSLMGKFGGLS